MSSLVKPPPTALFQQPRRVALRPLGSGLVHAHGTPPRTTSGLEVESAVWTGLVSSRAGGPGCGHSDPRGAAAESFLGPVRAPRPLLVTPPPRLWRGPLLQPLLVLSAPRPRWPGEGPCPSPRGPDQAGVEGRPWSAISVLCLDSALPPVPAALPLVGTGPSLRGPAQTHSRKRHGDAEKEVQPRMSDTVPLLPLPSSCGPLRPQG